MNNIFNNLDSIKIQFILYQIIICICYILFGISVLRLSKDSEKILHSIEYYVRIYGTLFLIWRFNPFRKIIIITELDKQLVFSTAFFLLSIILLNKILIDSQRQIKSYYQEREIQIKNQTNYT